MARKRGYQGTVILSVLVNREGRVDNLWVFESSGYNILDNAALRR
jgi:protein TonB